MADYKERVAEMLLDLLDAAPGRAENPLYSSLSDTVRKWGDQRQRVLERLMTLAAKALTEAADPLGQEWKVEIERTRALLKLIFRVDTAGQKLPMWAQNWLLAMLIAEDGFFNGLQMVQTIELIGKIRNEKMILDVMQDHLSKKWTMLNDLTAPFRTQQMLAIDEIEKIANAFLSEFDSRWRSLAEKAGGAYKKVDENLEKFREKTKDWPIKEMVVGAIDAGASTFFNLNTEGLRDTISNTITQAEMGAKLAVANNDLTLQRVRFYKDNLRSQGFILGLFAEERRLVREYERTNGLDAAALYQDLAHDAAIRWASERATEGQKDDAEVIKAFLIAQVDTALAAATEADKLFRAKYYGLFLENASEATEEALTSETEFKQRVANFTTLDIDDKISRVNERTNRIFEDAVDEAFETVERSIADFPVEVSEVLLVESREMHAAVKAVLNEKLKAMIDASAVLGKMFDRNTLEEAFERRELVEAVDR
jgi:hypothetical protein